MSQMNKRDSEVSFDGLVNLESVPPPAADGVHDARTAVGQLPDALLEELRRGSGGDALTRRLAPFEGPFPGGEDGFADEAPTAPGRDRVPPAAGLPPRPRAAAIVDASGAVRADRLGVAIHAAIAAQADRMTPTADVPLALNRIPTPKPTPAMEVPSPPRVPTLPPPDVSVLAVASAEAPVVAEAAPEVQADFGAMAMMPAFRRFPRGAGVVAVFLAIALAIVLTSLLVASLS